MRPACIRALWAIPFLISITRLSHLPHLSDQAISNFHLIIGLGEALIQFSAPRQLYSISIFQFLKERIIWKKHTMKTSCVLMEEKASAAELTNIIRFHFAKKFITENYLINLRNRDNYREIHEPKFVDCIFNFYQTFKSIFTECWSFPFFNMINAYFHIYIEFSPNGNFTVVNKNAVQWY